MPIRFRCAYCDQLMGISRRKAGTVVQCPRCAGQVIVPDPAPQRRPAQKQAVAQDAAKEKDKLPDPSAGEIFERSDIDKLLQNEPIAYNPAHQTLPSDNGGSVGAVVQPTPVVRQTPRASAGIVLTPVRMTVLAVGVVLLMGVAFFVGLLVGGR